MSKQDLTQDATSREFGHPLRVFALFRRLPNKIWIDSILTAVFSLGLAVLFALTTPFRKSGTTFAANLQNSLVYSFSIGYSIHLLSKIFVPRIRESLRDWPFVARLFADLLVWTLGAMIGVLLAGAILGRDFHDSIYTFVALVSGTVVFSVFFGITLRQQAVNELKTERDKAERSDAARALAVSRLRLLQAQIEPHFLFNTLANVSSLIEHDPKQARKMLDQFTLLLRASLDQTRKEVTKLSAEIQVVDAYLSVLKVRMGDRLTYSVDAPPELLNTEVPAMLLQPIVENAVKHGIEPRVKGGNVRVSAKREGDFLIFSVADDGVGFLPNRGENIGLGAVRERLAVQFGAAAALEIERTPEHWTCVTIRIPLTTSSAAR